MTFTTFAVGLAALALTPADGPVATGTVGHAHGLVDGQPIQIEQLAPCAVGDPDPVNTPGAEASGFVKFGAGSSTCRRNASGAAEVQVTGKKFRLDLRRWNGPLIKIANFSVACNTFDDGNHAGSEASLAVSGLSGIQVPNPIPENHTVTIPGTGPDAPPVARIVIHEVLRPDPPDGSMTVNLMHVTLFPEGVSIHNGHVVLGTVSCSPDPD